MNDLFNTRDDELFEGVQSDINKARKALLNMRNGFVSLRRSVKLRNQQMLTRL